MLQSSLPPKVSALNYIFPSSICTPRVRRGGPRPSAGGPHLPMRVGPLGSAASPATLPEHLLGNPKAPRRRPSRSPMPPRPRRGLPPRRQQAPLPSPCLCGRPSPPRRPARPATSRPSGGCPPSQRQFQKTPARSAPARERPRVGRAGELGRLLSRKLVSLRLQ